MAAHKKKNIGTVKKFVRAKMQYFSGDCNRNFKELFEFYQDFFI